MKKLLFTAIMTVFAITFSSAQQHFGAKAGLNLATITGDNTDGLKPLISFHVGAVAELSLSEAFSIQPEVVFSRQGNDYDESEFSTTNLDYLNFPIIAKYYVTEGLSLEAGPQVGILLSANDDDLGGDISDFIQSADFGLGLGAGYKLDNGLNFTARYNLGLTDINELEGPGSNQNGVLQISVGYFFN